MISFAAGQTFPGVSKITGVTAGLGLTGGGTSGNVTLNVNTSALNDFYAQLAANNAFFGNQTIMNATLTAGTGVSQAIIPAMVATGSDGNNVSLYPSLASQDFNNIVEPGDAALIYTNGAPGTGALDIAPWADAISGIRLNSHGEVNIGWQGIVTKNSEWQLAF